MDSDHHASTDAELVAAVNRALQAQDIEGTVAGLTELHRRHAANSAIRARLATALNNRGARKARNGALHDAESDVRRALALVPDLAEAQVNLARFLVASRDWGPAIALLDRLRARFPDDLDIRLDHAEALACGGAEHGEATLAAVLHEAATVSTIAGPRLALALATGGRSTEAIRELEASATDPEAAKLAMHTADRLCDGADWRAARRAYSIVAAAGGDGRRSPSLRAAIGARFALPAVYADADELAAARGSFDAGLDELIATYTPSRLARCDTRLGQLAWTHQMLAYQGACDRALLSRWGDWIDGALRVFAPRYMEPVQPGPRRAQPRIGIVSARLEHGVIGRYFGCWADALAAAGFTTVVFNVDPPADAAAARTGSAAATVVALSGSIESMAATIRESGLDALIYPDVGIDPRTTVLAALRLAPRQYAAWGHPETTGLASIDAYISCATMEPADAGGHYRERLLLLPAAGTRLALPGPQEAQTRDDFGFRAEDRIHLVPHIASKLHPDCDRVFAAIAASDPRAVLVFFRHDRPATNRVVQQRLTAALLVAGADPAQQLRFLPRIPRNRFLALCALADTMLDTLHWSGGANTLDALRVGLPVIGCPGPLMRGRQTLGLLHSIGLGAELMASDPQGMVELATTIAGDRERRRELGSLMRHRSLDLFDDTRPIDALIDALRSDLDPA